MTKELVATIIVIWAGVTLAKEAPGLVLLGLAAAVVYGSTKDE